VRQRDASAGEACTGPGAEESLSQYISEAGGDPTASELWRSRRQDEHQRQCENEDEAVARAFDHVGDMALDRRSSNGRSAAKTSWRHEPPTLDEQP
jgi:hypothetical protein